ncbi:hypothetical protein XANCAGTX0491_008417 [Xanthoria calcicola]
MTFFSFLSGLLVFQAHVVLCYPQQSSQYAAPKGASWASDCSDVIIPVAVQRSSDLQSLTSEYDINVLYALAGKSILASNSYNLSARICRPIPNRNVSASSDTIQLLVHGATFSKIMWDFPYQPETYSWTKRMNEAGYTTIAVDLVGVGNSSFPDGLRESQTQVYVETVHQVIQQLRDGKVAGVKWRKIALVGFSIGGIVANSLSAQYPSDLNAIVLHGISWDTTWVYPAFLSGLQSPAARIDPGRWGSIPPQYQTQSTREAREASIFYGSFDRGILEADFYYRDFASLGAAMTFTYHLVDAPEYRGPVFLGIGENDSTFCGGTKCIGQPYELYNRYPEASNHTVQVYESTGHLILFHHAGAQLMEDSLHFLKAHGF